MSITTDSNSVNTHVDGAAIPTRQGIRDGGNKCNIRVAVRVRNLLPMESLQGAKTGVCVLDRKLLLLMDPGTTAVDDFLRLNKSRERRYAFDIVFDENASQQQVYDEAGNGIVDGVLRGINSTIFAYGATGAGKTHTMLGNYTEPGLMSLTLTDMFKKLEPIRKDKDVQVKCSFMEVYNENIRDLLGPGQDLPIREDPVKGMCVAGVVEVSGLSTVEEIMDLLYRGNRNRTSEPTSANVTSSRSHAILQVVVELREKGQGMVSNVQIGKLSLIDLAGSERASVTHNKGIRLLEGANINRSLLALGNCITALADNGSRGAFVPYRDSKLTRLLKDSLGGNCKTVMIANISPSNLNFEDTSNTLKYANRAKNIQTEQTNNKTVTVSQHISNYNDIISELKGVVYDLRGRLSVVEHRDESVKEASEQWKQELVDNIDERVRLKKSCIDLKNQMVSLTTSSGEEDETLTEQLSELKQKRIQIDERIAENETSMIAMRQQLPRRVQNEDVCAFLLLLYRNQILEIEAMDREDNVELTRKRHEEEIKVKDALIESQANTIKSIVPHLHDLPEYIQENFAKFEKNANDLIVPSSPLQQISRLNLLVEPPILPVSTRIRGMATLPVRVATAGRRPPLHGKHQNGLHAPLSNTQNVLSQNVEAAPSNRHAPHKRHVSHRRQLAPLMIQGTGRSRTERLK